MAVTLMRSTIHKSVEAFDKEITAWVKSKEFKNGNGVIVSVLTEGGIRYIGTGTGKGREIVITGFADGNVKIEFVHNDSTIISKTANYIVVALQSSKSLTFLLEGVVPESICEEVI